MTKHKAQELQTYELINKATGKKHISLSDTPQNACKQAGWQIDDCSVRDVSSPPTQDHNPLRLADFKIPCQVCPYQYGECTKPAEARCPARTNTPNLSEWMKQVMRAHLCQYTGVALTEKNYHQHQK